MSQVEPTPAYTQSRGREWYPPAEMVSSLQLSSPSQRGPHITGPIKFEPRLPSLAATHARLVQPGIHP